jgi:hypothetical protein
MRYAFLILVVIMLTSGNVLSQDLLGKNKAQIIDYYKARRDLIIKSINDTIIEYSFITSDNILQFSFRNDSCTLHMFSCNEASKNYFIAKYVEEGYSVEVEKKPEAKFVTLNNGKYLIQMACGAYINLVYISYLY